MTALPTPLEPVDVIFPVDDSSSMAQAIDQLRSGINGFATQLGNIGLDYRIIVLSLRSKTNPVSVSGNTRYALCVLPPLAGDLDCGNGERFFQSSIDVRSEQTLEQLLGTLGQTTGYTASDSLGGEACVNQLRDSSIRHIVVVTDDNARLSRRKISRISQAVPTRRTARSPCRPACSMQVGTTVSVALAATRFTACTVGARSTTPA